MAAYSGNIRYLRESHRKMWMLISDVQGTNIWAKSLEGVLRKRALPVVGDTDANLQTLVDFLRAQRSIDGAAGATGATHNVGRKSAVAEAQEALALAAPSGVSSGFATITGSPPSAVVPRGGGGPWRQLLPLCVGSFALLARTRAGLQLGGLVAALTVAVAGGLLLARRRKNPVSNPERLPSSQRTDLRHGVIRSAIPIPFLAEQYDAIRAVFKPHVVSYKGQDWRISSYMELMDRQFISGKHATAANVAHAPPENVKPDMRLLATCRPLLCLCDAAFISWYKRVRCLAGGRCERLHSFVTRYKPIRGHDQLRKHVDGRHIDGSVILRLPDSPDKGRCVGGTLKVWDGKPKAEFEYDMRPGDLCMLDRMVWHQACPITAGEKWAIARETFAVCVCAR